MNSRIARTFLVVAAALLGLALIGVVVVWRAFALPAPLKPVADAFTVEDVTIINPGRPHLAHQTLGVEDGHVVAPGARSGPDLSRYRGMYVLPGLIDMHSHKPPGNPLQLTSYFQLLELAHGVTSVRDAADIDGTSMTALRAAEEEGYPGPRVFACGPFVSAGRAKWANTILLRGPEDAEPAVARLKAQGSHCVKAYDGLTQPMVVALREATARHGLRLIGHVPETLTYEQAMLPDAQHLMGVAPWVSPAHRLVAQRGWDQVGDERLREIADFAVRNGLANTPTLVLDQQVLGLESDAAAKASPAGQLMPRFYRDVVWDPRVGIPAYRGLQRADFDLVRAALAGKMKLVRRLHEAGAQLYLGTDVQQPYVVPGLALQQEMRLFAESGVPVEDIWAIGTSESGRSLGLAQLGTIVPGAPADLLIFARDPTMDLDALSSLQAVVSRGRLYTKEDLDAKVAAYQSHYAGLVFDGLSTVLAAAAVRKTMGH
jgi:hypothetical protein